MQVIKLWGYIKMKKKIIIYGLVLVVIISGVILFNKNKNKTKFISVKTSVAKVDNIKSYLSTTATIKSKSIKNYYGLQGKVKKVSIKVGDKVKKGDLLVTYEAQDLATTVKQAQLQLDNSILQKNDTYNQNTDIKNKIADLTVKISDYDGTIATLKSSKVPTDALELTKAQSAQTALINQKDQLKPISSEKLKQADNATTLAKISLDSAKQKVTDNQSTMVSDLDGTVTTVNLEEGAIATGAQIAIVVQSTDSLKAVATLGKFDANKVVIGQLVSIINADKIYSGKVSAIDPVAKKILNQVNGDTALGVEIDITDTLTNLKVDFDVDVDILVAEAKGVLKIPVEALKTEKGNKNYVYVLTGDLVHQKSVTLGIQSANDLEIKSGIKNGDKVILNPSTSITEGVHAKDSLEVK